MKTTILKDKLKNGINIVERISAKSLSLPILNNVLMTVEKNFLNFTTTDLEVGINWWSLVKVEKEGKIAIPAKILSSFLNFLPDKPVVLEVKNLNLEVECENYKTSIKGFNPEEFPIIPRVSKEENISVSSQLFCRNLSQVVDVASYSSAKPEISGVNFSFQSNLITMVATDSFRLAEKKFSLKSSSSHLSKNYSLILPQRAAKEVINIFGDKEGNLIIYFSPNQILFEFPLPETPHPQIQLISRLIEGEYPNYQEIIPKEHDTKIIVQTNEFINQIKLAALFSGKVNEIKLKADPQKNQLNLSSQNPDIGEHQSFLNCKIEGKACEVSFNHRFLLDGLLNIKEPEVVLDLTGSEKPGVMRPKGDSDYLYLVMPIKAN